MIGSTLNQQVHIELVGGTTPTDELLELLADMLLDLVDQADQPANDDSSQGSSPGLSSKAS